MRKRKFAFEINWPLVSAWSSALRAIIICLFFGNGPGQYLWCFMHQMGSTVQITRATEQQQQSLLLWTAPSQERQNRGCQGGATGPGQYLWCLMHQMGSTVQIAWATEQQQQSLLLRTAPSYKFLWGPFLYPVPTLVQIYMSRIAKLRYVWKLISRAGNAIQNMKLRS